MKYYSLILLILLSCTSSSNELLNESEYQKFGERLIYLIKNRKTDKLEDSFYPKRTFKSLEDTINSLGLKERAEIARWEKFRSEHLNTFDNYMRRLSQMVDDSTFIEVSRFYVKNETAHLVVSVVSKNQFEISDFELLTQGDNIYISNIESYNTGINFGQAFIFNSINKLEYGWMGGEYMDALDQLKNAHVYLQRGQPDRAWIAFNRVPDYFAYQSNFQVIKNSIAYQLSDSLYEKTLFDWIGNNWDNKGFRYLKGYTYYSYFGDSVQSKLYLDSLTEQSGNDQIKEILKTN